VFIGIEVDRLFGKYATHDLICFRIELNLFTGWKGHDDPFTPFSDRGDIGSRKKIHDAVHKLA